jgi:hypothetical protein
LATAAIRDYAQNYIDRKIIGTVGRLLSETTIAIRPKASGSSLRLVADLLICNGLFGGPDRDRTDDLFHAMKRPKT